jgi:hypothetical protein
MPLGEFPENSEKFYDILATAEAGAGRVLTKDLDDLGQLLRMCFACGVSLTDILPRVPGFGVAVATPILRRCLTDLRAVWVLMSIGYSSQAASVAAELVEGALAIAAVCADEKLARRWYESPQGDLPWKVKTLCKMVADKVATEKNLPPSERQRTQDVYYTGYRYLCKIKHPTLPSLLHDAEVIPSLLRKAGVPENFEHFFFLTSVPNLRREDLPVKRTILIISAGHLSIGITHFADACGLDKKSDKWSKFQERYDKFSEALSEASRRYWLTDVPENHLPFNAAGSDWVQYRSGLGASAPTTKKV